MWHIPNVITTYSFFFSLLSRWFLWYDNIMGFVIFNHLGYFFDCMDGQFARKYDMVSQFGDIYDHTTDIFVDVLLFVIIWKKYQHVIPMWCIALIPVAAFMLAMSMGCQQLNYNSQPGNELIDVNRILCPSASSIQWTRFFGAGTWQWFMTMLVVFLHIRATAYKTTHKEG